MGYLQYMYIQCKGTFLYFCMLTQGAIFVPTNPHCICFCGSELFLDSVFTFLPADGSVCLFDSLFPVNGLT